MGIEVASTVRRDKYPVDTVGDHQPISAYEVPICNDVVCFRVNEYHRLVVSRVAHLLEARQGFQ